MFCVNVKSKEFKEACSRLDIHPSSLETIVFQYLNNIDSNGFPSDSYIMEKLQGIPMTGASKEQIQLWEKAHSKPMVFNTAEQASNKIRELSKYYDSKSISSYRNNEGNYVVTVVKPRTEENSYEVSTAGDRRFSAMVAKFNPGTIIEGVDVGGMTIEQVYQSVIKKSRKGQPPAKSSKLYKAPVSSYTGNITPEENTIFVFGSNHEGRHGAGAAKIAREQFGAIYGQGEGLQGNSYALPTKDLRVKENRGLRSIPEETIINSIRTLYEVARQNPDKQFKIAYRNTDSASLNGYTGLEMIDMFIKAGDIPSNIIFSKEWVDTGKFEMSSQELEDYSYKEGYLPLWQEWAKQNPQLIEELRENSAGKTLTDKFANTRVSQARALAEILNSTRKEESTTTESSSELETKTIDEQYMENSTALISQIEDLGNIGLSPSEIKHLGEQLMWWISDHLTWLQNNPSKLEETYGIKDKDASLMSREELTSLITPSQLMTKCVEAFTKRQFKSLSQKSKVRKIANNWRALMFLSAKTFADIEGFGIIDSAAGFNVLQKIQTLVEDYNNDNDIDAITETTGDIQEHWQLESRTIDVMNAMTPEVRLALLQCYVLDKDGNPVISEFGIKERIKPRQAVNTILRIAQGQITVEGIVKKLKENRDQYPWFDQLIARLEDQSGTNSNFKSAFFSTFCKPFVTYSVVRKNPSTGVYESVIINEFPALREAMNTITTQYKMRQHPMLGDTLTMDTFNAVKDIYTSLKDVKFADINVEELVNKLTYIYNALGYYVTPDLVSNIITESNYKTIVENLGYIINNLTEGYTNNNGTYDPFKFGRGNKNIITSTRAIIKIITDTLEDTALSSTFDNGKMYQSYVTPSYLTKLMQKFTIFSDEEFKKFMQEEYGQYRGWFTDSKGEYRLSWLKALSSSPEMRAIFKHKVQLNFNKHNYMRNMTDAEYTLSVISEFFAESDKAIGNYNVAWYRVPMMSNKPSSEFIRFVAHKGSFYKDTITDSMYDIFLQELSRIQTVRMRNKGKKDIDFIKNFDTNGAKFCFLDFFNEYLNGSQKTSTFGRILNKKLEGKELTEEEKSILIEESKKIIKEHMEAKAKGIIQEWKAQGIVAQCSKIKGINPANIESELENFIWNDTLASMNIIQMTVTDIAYYKDAEDLQKRFAQIHSPGVRGNNDARDFSNNKVTDGYHRTVYLADFEGVISNVIENITIVFDRKIKEAEDAGRTTEADSLKALKESLVGEKGAYREINVTDAQGYCCATSYRKKAFIFGKWNKAKEEVYNRLMQGDYTSTDLEIAFQPLKPFVYSQISKSSGVADAPMGKLKTPIQNKNSEYLLLLAGAILQNEDTGKPNLLRAINEVMEESAEKSPTMGIDTIQFASAVKSSLTGVIDINDVTNVEEAKERIRKAIYPDYKGDWKSYTPKVDYDERTVHKIPVEDYCIQQEVPPHFRDHDQAHGSQTRAIIIADLADGNYVIREGKTTRTVKKEEFIKEYEKTIAANIEEDINTLAEELHLVGSSPAERNIAISRILQREILSNPNRYGTDLLVACSVDSNGNFRIPLGDPVQAKRVEQLINSIVKNRISKQKLPGGPVVQVSNFGTSRQLSIVFKGKDGKPLRKRAKGESETSYKEYLQKNQAGIAYMECFAPAYTLDLFKNFMDENGNVDIEAIEATDPELLKMVGYRIPTEDKYSIAPLKIVGFLPKEAGDGIMLPYDITLINGSDFDIKFIGVIKLC